jgi:hypothetical protein
LSFEQSVIFGEFRIARSHIDGSIFANDSFINKSQILDTEVRGSLLFRHAILFDPAIFDTVSASGELSLRGAALSHFLLQFSDIGGVLDLSESQARCAYNIRKSEIGDLVAVKAGFGNSTQLSDGAANDRPVFNWRETGGFAELVRAAVEGEGAIADASHCSYPTIEESPTGKEPGAFVVFDTRVKSSLCLRSFFWLAPMALPQPSSIELNDVKVGAAAMIDLTPVVAAGGQAKGLPGFRMVGFDANSLVFDFGNGTPVGYDLFVSGLNFEHVYAAKSDCKYDPAFARPGSEGTIRPSSVPVPALRRPGVEEVMSWLDGNHLVTTQPFSAFVDVFQKHGEVNDARELRIAKASAELCLKAHRVFGNWICRSGAAEVSVPQSNKETEQGKPCSRPPGDFASAEDPCLLTRGRAPSSEGFGFGKIIDYGNNFAAVSLGFLLSKIADHGYHPEKVGWFVLGTILLFLGIFWVGLRIVGLKPKDKEIIHPIGLMFLFDRLLPAYQIREDHYNIDKFYKRGTPSVLRALAQRIKRRLRNIASAWQEWRHGRIHVRKFLERCLDPAVAATTAVGPNPITMRYLGRNLAVVEATETERRTVERCLDALKLIGLVLAIFLVAAINAIVSH